MEAASILFAAAMTYFVSLAAGLVLLRILKLNLARSEERFFGFLAGAAILSLLVFGLAVIHLAYTSVFLALGLIAIAASYWLARGRTRAQPALAPIPARWRALFWILFAVYLFLYLPNAMAPETSADGVAYHVGLIARYYHLHSYQWLTTSLYADLSQGVEMLFLFAFALASGLGRQSAAAAVHFLFLLTLPFGMISYGRRFGMPRAGVAAALLFFMTPVAGKSGTSAYNDVAVAAILFGLFYALELWAEERSERLLVVAGLLAGFAYAIKYTAFLATPFAIGYVLLESRRNRASAAQPNAVRSAAITTACAFLAIAPWMIKDWIMVANPLAPFFNTVFRNPYMYPLMEWEYRYSMAHFNQVAYREIPMEVCVRGYKLLGLLGPAFFLSPLALLALKNKRGRTLLFTTLVFGAAYFTNTETRFLIPALPFLTLALALAVGGRFAMVLLLAHALLSWPAVTRLYSDQYAWRITEMPWRLALLRTGENAYLAKNIGDGYQMAMLIRQYVPAGEKILSFSDPLARSYLDHDVAVAYESAWGRRMADAVWAAQAAASGPNWRAVDYRFPPRIIQRIRLLETAPGEQSRWGVNELRFFRDGREIVRNPAWKLSAWPNPWDVQLAFDSNPVTQWSSWEFFRPGMYIDVDFGAPVEIDEVSALCEPDECKIRASVEEWSAGGWHPMAAQEKGTIVPAQARLRAAATAYIKSNGVRWLVSGVGNWAFRDFAVNRIQWGITPIAHTREHVLYRLD